MRGAHQSSFNETSSSPKGSVHLIKFQRCISNNALRHQLVTMQGKVLKGALSWYGKLTWESAHAWNLIILCLLIDSGMTVTFKVHLSFYAIPLLIYDVIYDITTIPQGTQL